jgi:hypothetical protein
MLTFAGLLNLLALGSTALQGAAAGGRPLAEVPFALHQNAIIVPAIINDRDTVRLLLDTGWGPVALVSTAAQRLGLPVDPPPPGGLGRAHVSSLSIGDARVITPLIEVFSTEALAPLIGPHDGILGTAFFRNLVLQVDYPAGVVRFLRRSPIPAADGRDRASVPMVFSPRAGALPFTDSVFVDGRAVRGLFDTGGAGAFVAMPQLVQRARLRPTADSGRARMGMLSGDSTVQQPVRFTRFGRVSIGPLAVDSARVLIAPPQMPGGEWGHDLVIGYGFMRRYVVTFDYPGRIVRLELPLPVR